MYLALRNLALAFVAVLATAGTPNAATIAEWDVAGSDGATALVLNTAANVSAGDLAAVNVASWPGGFCCFTAAADWGIGASPDLAKYFEFSIIADPGYSVTYQSITLSLFRGIQGALHGAESWELRASHDGFAAALVSFDLAASGADTQVLFSAQDISGIGTQAGTVTFRLYGFDYTSAADFSGLGNHPGPTPLAGTGSNLVVAGTNFVQVPEPSSLALASLGLVLLATFSERSGRRRAAAAGKQRG